MPEDPEDETRRLIADVDRIVEQSQSLQSDITKQMREQRAEDQPVTQPLGRRSRNARRRG